MTREELLVVLIEECGEVIQAATKCLRFGWDRDEPGYGLNNRVLAKEIGDLTAMIDALPLDRQVIQTWRELKMERVEKWKAYAESHLAAQAE